MKRAALVLALAVVVASPRRASAQADRSEALALDFFNRGIKQREAGRCDEQPMGDVATCREALESFRRAYALSPKSLGALRNVAYLEKALGLTATAARHFRELAQKAPSDPKPERRLWAGFASKEANELEAASPHLTIEIPAGGPTKVLLDGAPLPEAAWGTHLEVDPGEHTVRAERADAAPFETAVTLTSGDDRKVVVRWDHHDAEARAPATPAPAPGSAPVASEEAREGDRPNAREHPSPAETRSVVGPLVLGVAGLAAAGVGLGLGAAAMSKRNAHCDDVTKTCDPAALSAAKDLAGGATIAVVAGAAAVAGAVVWYVLSPRGGGGRSVSLAPTLRMPGAVLTGSF